MTEENQQPTDPSTNRSLRRPPSRPSGSKQYIAVTAPALNLDYVREAALAAGVPPNLIEEFLPELTKTLSRNTARITFRKMDRALTSALKNILLENRSAKPSKLPPSKVAPKDSTTQSLPRSPEPSKEDQG